DFWAPWCGPCKQLMPVLEEIINAQGGKVALAKVNIDENPELAQAFRVQSVPTVIAMFMGQPVSGFQGVRPKSDIENLINQLLQIQKQQMPDALDIPSALAAASDAMAENNFDLAQNIYGEILAEDNLNAAAFAGMIRILIAVGEIGQAKAVSDGLPEQIAKDPNITSVRTALELALNRPPGALDEIERRLAAQSDNPDILFEYAEAAFAAGEKDKAVDTLIALIKKHKDWEEDKARKQLLKYFEAWGVMDPASASGRRKLSSLLFS
ncbi:MAG: thioredoxin family protein, partial [Micavibrio aeruginosavorus]